MNRTVDRPLQELRRGVEGLSPDAEKHEFFFDIEPVSWVLFSKLHIKVQYMLLLWQCIEFDSASIV